jgi:hypothetical protein
VHQFADLEQELLDPTALAAIRAFRTAPPES